VRNKNCTRYFSRKQEDSVAKAVGGKRTANSGATMFSKGDVKAKQFLIECKTCMTAKQSFSIKKEWLEKNQEEAFSTGKQFSALAFNFGPNMPNYYIIDEKTFKKFLRYLDEEAEQT